MENNNVKILESAVVSLESVQLLMTHEEKKTYPKIKNALSIIKNTGDLFEYKLLWDESPNIRNLRDAAQIYIQSNLKKDLEELNILASNIIEAFKVNKQFNELITDPEKRKNIDIQEFVYFKKSMDKFNTLEESYKNFEQKNKFLEKINKNLLERQRQAEEVVEDLKNKYEFLNQKTDEHSNTHIQKLYSDIYDVEIQIADTYRNWALGIFAVISLLLIWKFFNFSLNFNNLGFQISIPSKRIGWESALNILLLLGLSTPAWYLARESSAHRKVAYKAKILGTELSSFPLYVRELKDEDRLELRKQLADRFFGQELYSESKINSNSDNSLEQIKLLTEANKVLVESLKIKKIAE